MTDGQRKRRKDNPGVFAGYLADLLDERGETATEVANRAGFNPSTMSKWLRGYETSPNMSNLHRLAQAIGEPVADLVALVYPDEYGAPLPRAGLIGELAELLETLPESDRRDLEYVIDRLMEPYRRRCHQ